VICWWQYKILTALFGRVDNGFMGHGSNGSPKADGSYGSWVNVC
jgi:hypothetical protein